jgi:hypothetical protein
MAQNVLIGIVAFLMALWATMSLEKKETGGKPSSMEFWYRFPKFMIGFLVASLVVFFLVEPAWIGFVYQWMAPRHTCTIKYESGPTLTGSVKTSAKLPNDPALISPKQ